MRFKPGDRVRVVKGIHTGEVFTVLRTGIDAIHVPGDVFVSNAVELDGPPSTESSARLGYKLLKRPETLRHVYDGHEPTTWDECAWKPKGIEA